MILYPIIWLNLFDDSICSFSLQYVVVKCIICKRVLDNVTKNYKYLNRKKISADLSLMKLSFCPNLMTP